MEKNLNLPEPKVSFNTTVFNNMPWVGPSLISLIDICKILKDSHNVNCEIIIVDNFSDDGTFEEIRRIRHLTKDIPIKLSQYKCKRGLGRHLALALSRGSHLVYVDMDVVYNTELVAGLISSYLENSLFSAHALYIAFVPRALALNVGAFQDLNRTEDVEFCARLAKENMVLPLMDPTTFRYYANVSELEKEHGKKHEYANPSSKMFVETYASERRYVISFSGYLKRELNNKIDMIRGLGLNPTKIVRELWFLKKMRGSSFLISAYFHLSFWLITKLTSKEIFEHSKIFSNNVLCDYVMFNNYSGLLSQATRLGLIERDCANNLVNGVFAQERIRNVVKYVRAFGR
jgi:glycosyltransferase involved in cell wall biosynthesis